METTSHPAPRVLTPSDIDGAMALVAEAGWNQVVADWHVMWGRGGAVGIEAEDGALAATALAWPYKPDFGWISMVLVTASHRRRGMATALLRDRIDWLRARGMTPVLDATELGEPVYGRIGFAGDQRFTRWEGTGGAVAPNACGTRPARIEDRGWIVALDRAVFGAERAFLLDDFIKRPGSGCWVSSESESGFVIVRKGRRATQIGPLTAADEATAIDLLATVLAEIEGPIFLDALDIRAGLHAFIRASGMTRQRGFVRMSLGDSYDFDGNGRTMIIAGPEYG